MAGTAGLGGGAGKRDNPVCRVQVVAWPTDNLQVRLLVVTQQTVITIITDSEYS